MKKTKKIISMVMLVLAALLTLVTTVSAEAIGDTYGISGFGLGWIIVAAVIILALIAIAMQVTKAAIKPFVPILVVAFIVGLALQYDIPEPATEVTPAILWSVSSVVNAGNVTTDDDARTITILYYGNVTGETMNDTDESAYTAPIINFTIAPAQAAGITDLTKAATTTAIVNNPDKEFTEDTTTYDLFADASGENKKSLAWLADDTTEYETHYCTVAFGASETVLLTIGFNDDGLHLVDIGDSQTFTLTIGGITYTATIICIVYISRKKRNTSLLH